MEQKIQTLVDQIYRDGMEKAARDAEHLLEKAGKEADRIREEARAEADAILRQATEKSDEERRRSAAEMELAAGQALSRLRQAVQSLVSARVLEEGIGQAALDPAFLRELILEIAKAWFRDPAREAELEVILPEKLKDRAEAEFARAIQSALADLELNFDSSLKGGFRIARKNDVYMVDFSDEALAEFFRPFLKKKTAELFFPEKSSS